MDNQRPGAETPQYDNYASGSQTGSQAGSQINLNGNTASSSMLQLRSSTQVTLVETATESPSSYNFKEAKSSTPTLSSQKEEQYHIPEDLSRHTSPAITQVRRTSTDTEDGTTEWSFAAQLKVSHFETPSHNILRK